MGGSTPSAPKAIDAGKSQGQYMFGQDFKNSGGITDPYLQGRIIDSEATFRPLYTALELADIQTMAQGLSEDTLNPQYKATQDQITQLETDLAKGKFKDKKKTRQAERRLEKLQKSFADMPEYMKATPGLFDLLEEQSSRAGKLQREQLSLQRADDVNAIREFAPQVVEAYRNADPYSTGLVDQQTAMANDLYQRAQGLNPEQQRIADQQALGMSQRMGRIGDQSSVAAQVLGREQYLASLRAEAGGVGLQAFNQNRVMAGDVGSTILGRTSNAIGLGNQVLSQAQVGAAQPMGPQLFDPNMGVNMAMQQQSNQLQANIAGAANKTAITGAIIGAVGSIGGGAAGKPAAAAPAPPCWVAREVYGIDNPQWMQFREWMLNDSSSLFRKLYLKYGERFAEFISNKPRIKSIIRKWMNTKIN
tara:strand:+ start:467 stop:1723 length:1257 start_codon:yes stop_codon:yes gene_type:complete